ncbi:MAG: RHS repeat-associated core domain-containing protein, partial [Thermoanaerobaculia bacterium]
MDETRYRLRTASVLGEGVHEIAVTNGLSDLAGRHLESEYQSPFEVSPLVPNLLVFDAGDARYLTTSALLNTLGFHGLEHDSETGFVYMRNRYYDPGLGRFISADPLGYVDGPSLYGFAGNSPYNSNDPLGLAVYAFDGTGNDWAAMKSPTNVAKLCASVTPSSQCFYREGVGAPAGTKILGGVAGAGGLSRLEWMYKRLVEAYNAGDHDIDIIGFSRGAALARAFANMIHERGIPDWSSRRTEHIYVERRGIAKMTVHT